MRCKSLGCLLQQDGDEESESVGTNDQMFRRHRRTVCLPSFVSESTLLYLPIEDNYRGFVEKIRDGCAEEKFCWIGAVALEGWILKDTYYLIYLCNRNKIH